MPVGNPAQPCGRNDGYINVESDHFIVCEEHPVYWYVGSNLFSDWRDETEEEWQRSRQKLEGRTRVRPVRGCRL